MQKVVCLGEIMLRLSTNDHLRFVQANCFNAIYGGSEANVAVSLANLGLHSVYVTKVPENELGQAAVNELRKYGVDTSHIARGGERLGIYFLEKGASQRPLKVIYDRKYSSVSQADINDFNWHEIFKGTNWFHFSGITLAISRKAAELTLSACKAAKEYGVKVICDINYRKNLWSDEVNSYMNQIMQYVDICIGNADALEKVFNLSVKSSSTTELPGKEEYQIAAQQLLNRYKLEKVALTMRGYLTASDNNWAAMLFDGQSCCFSKNYPVRIIDRVGAGDSFTAGLIYALLQNQDAQSALDFATAASCLKHTIEGDFNLASLEEINNLCGHDAHVK